MTKKRTVSQSFWLLALSASISILLVVLRVEEWAITLVSIMHIGHLISAPWLSAELLGAGGTTASIKVAVR